MNDVELTRRALLQGAALTAGALVRPDHARFAIAAQAVSAVTVRIIYALYFLKDFAESLGGRGQIPLLVAAWTPPVAAILLAVGLLLHLEDG